MPEATDKPNEQPKDQNLQAAEEAYRLASAGGAALDAVFQTAADEIVYMGDPVAQAEIIDSVAEQGVSIKEMIESAEGQPFNLELETGSGKLVLEKVPFGTQFRIASSEDPTIPEGKELFLDSSTTGGGWYRMDLLAPNLRASFLRLVPYVCTVDPKLEGEVIKPEDVEQWLKERPTRIKDLGNGQYELLIVNPKPRTTDFVAHAKMTVHGKKVTEERQLF